jgi:RNA-directed DNA polymerase
MSTKKQEMRERREGQAKRPVRPDPCRVIGGAGAIESAGNEEQPKLTVNHEAEPPTQQLMERVVDPDNMNRAYKRVVSNKGAAGVDRMTVNELREWIRGNKESLTASLLNGSYKPEPVREVAIPKVSGGVRQLGIPTVVDSLV